MEGLRGGRWSGLLLLVAGVLFGGFMFWHPPNDVAGAMQPIWVPVHGAWLLAYGLMVCGWVPLYGWLGMRGRWVALGYGLAFLGLVLSLPIAVWDSFVVPELAVHAPGLIELIEEGSMEAPALVFRGLVFLGIFVFSVGFGVLGVTGWRSGLWSGLTGLGLAIGAPLFWLGALVVSQGPMGNGVTELGAVLFGVGMGRLGWLVWRGLEQGTEG